MSWAKTQTSNCRISKSQIALFSANSYCRGNFFFCMNDLHTITPRYIRCHPSHNYFVITTTMVSVRSHDAKHLKFVYSLNVLKNITVTVCNIYEFSTLSQIPFPQ